MYYKQWIVNLYNLKLIILLWPTHIFKLIMQTRSDLRRLLYNDKRIKYLLMLTFDYDLKKKKKN